MLQLNCSSRGLAHRPSLKQQTHRLLPCRLAAQSGRTEPFNEGAVQVKRLVDRDRAQMLGNKVDILDKFETEFGDPSTSEPRPAPAAAPAAPAAAKAVSAAAPAAAAPAAAPAAPAPASAPSSSSSPSSSSAPPASPFAAAAPAAAAKPAAAVQTKFNAPGGGGAASPFGAATNPRQMRSMMEPRGLAPDMSPDPIVKLAPTPGNLLSKITLTQVVLFCTFGGTIALMLFTFQVVVNSGAVRLAGVE